MVDRKIDSNSGVQANVGFDFQRNTCIYIFLEEYNTLKTQEYFIMLEHYDDIVFGFLNQNGELSEVTTYQAKKSSNVWTTNKVYEIIQKISRWTPYQQSQTDTHDAQYLHLELSAIVIGPNKTSHH